MNFRWVKILLIVCAVYDGLLGAVFALVPAVVYRTTAITLPNHLGYVRFPALLLLIFAVMFWRAAADPVRHSDTLVYGMALKLSYFALVFWYQLRAGVPHLWIPFAYADVLFFVLFYFAWTQVTKKARA